MTMTHRAWNLFCSNINTGKIITRKVYLDLLIMPKSNSANLQISKWWACFIKSIFLHITAMKKTAINSCISLKRTERILPITPDQLCFICNISWGFYMKMFSLGNGSPFLFSFSINNTISNHTFMLAFCCKMWNECVRTYNKRIFHETGIWRFYSE